MKTYLFNILLGFDQLANTLAAGYPDETISARTYRLRNKTKAWQVAHITINTLLFFQKDHCYKAYLAEIQRKQSPVEERSPYTS
jgi:hypothetical protein